MVKGTVGIVVKNPAQKQPSTKIVARKGRIEAVEEEGEAEPNGTEFVIATRDSPELDSAALAVGRVVDGMDVVEKIAGVSAVKDNAGSPYFRVAKLIGDKRAVVAERGFNRPYVKVRRGIFTRSAAARSHDPPLEAFGCQARYRKPRILTECYKTRFWGRETKTRKKGRDGNLQNERFGTENKRLIKFGD